MLIYCIITFFSILTVLASFRYGNEDKLAGLCGVIQALVSVAKDSENDSIRSIHTPTCTIVFLATGPLILASVSKTNENETQLSLQLR